MNYAVRISESEMQELRAAAEVNSRSIAGQAEHWMRIGRAVERDPAMAYSQIELALRGLKPLKLDELSDDEQDDFLDQLADLDAHPTPARDAFYSERRRRGLGVGLDDAGNIVKQQPEAGA